MISLRDIISALVPHNDVSNFIDDFKVEDKDESLLNILLRKKRKTAEDVIRFLTNTNINQYVNRKKMISLIRNESVNNELILFFSGYYDCNIWIYNTLNKIFKVYYLEEQYQFCKENIFIMDTPEGFQVVTFKNVQIDDVLKKYIVIPLGVAENKVWKTGKEEDNPLYENLIMDCLMEECPEDPFPQPYINITRFLKRIKNV